MENELNEFEAWAEEVWTEKGFKIVASPTREVDSSEKTSPFVLNIRNAKLNHIAKLYHKVKEVLPISLKNDEEYNKVLNYWKREGISLDIPFALTGYCFAKTENQDLIYEFYSKEHIAVFYKDIALLQTVDYNPPDNILIILNHLFCLWTYYPTLWNSESFDQLKKLFTGKVIENILDLSLCKLSEKVSIFYCSLHYYDWRDRVRIKKTNMKRKEHTEKGQKEVKEVFTKLMKSGILWGRTFNKVATEIRNHNNCSGMSLDTIKRYLKADPDILGHFKDEGRTKVMKM